MQASLRGLLSAWRWRRAQPSQSANSADADAPSAPATFPIEAYNAALDRLVKIAFESGARQEKARMAAIARLPKAERFPRLGLSLALSGVVSVEQALDMFAAAELDVSASPPVLKCPAPESDGRVLH